MGVQLPSRHHPNRAPSAAGRTCTDYGSPCRDRASLGISAQVGCHDEKYRRKRSSKQIFEYIRIVPFQSVCKFVYLEHVWRKPLCTYANRELRSILIRIEQYESDAKEHAQRLQSALVLLRQCGWHRNVCFGRK